MIGNLLGYQHGLNLNDPETDHDGIGDGAEYHYWQSRLYSLWGGWVNSTTGKKVNDTAISYCKIVRLSGLVFSLISLITAGEVR